MESTEKNFSSTFIQVSHNNEVTNDKENLFDIGPEVPLLTYEKQTHQTNISQHFVFEQIRGAEIYNPVLQETNNENMVEHKV